MQANKRSLFKGDCKTMDKSLESFLVSSALPSEGLVGCVGAGRLGQMLGEYFATAGHEVVYCDPARQRADLEDLDDIFQQQWGNGMGGCGLSGAGALTYLPLPQLARDCRVLCIQVPLTTTGTEATDGLISDEFLKLCRPDCRILCFADRRVLGAQAQKDARVSVYCWA